MITRDEFPYVWSLLPLVAVIIIRRVYAVKPLFVGEFIIEDIALVLIALLALSPIRIRAFVWAATTCFLNAALVAVITMTQLRGSLRPRNIVLAIVFSILAIHSGRIAMKAGWRAMESGADKT